MIIFKKAATLHNYLRKAHAGGLSTALVPTMGALHPGHISLIRAAKTANDLCICSIFVNPAQFNDPSDFARYPVTTASDIALLELNGCDILFLPSVEEMYPASFQPREHYDLGELENRLEGAFRPGHFQGVCKVINRLLDIVIPHSFYLGQKDYQQCMVVDRLIGLLGLSGNVQLVIVPTLRESDGLAMSSRNVRLDSEQRKTAVTIFRALSSIRDGLNYQLPRLLIEGATRMLEENGFRVDYVAICRQADLEPVDPGSLAAGPLVALVAAFLGEVRLIDNMLLTGQDAKHL